MGGGWLPHLLQIKLKPQFIELGVGGGHPCLPAACLTSWRTVPGPRGLGGRGRGASVPRPVVRSLGQLLLLLHPQHKVRQLTHDGGVLPEQADVADPGLRKLTQVRVR